LLLESLICRNRTKFQQQHVDIAKERPHFALERLFAV